MFSTILLPLSSYTPDPATLAQLKNLVCVPDGRVVLLRLNSDQARFNVEFEPAQRHLDAVGLNCTVIERPAQFSADSPAVVIAEVAAELNVDVIVMGGPGVNLEIDSTSTAASVIELVSCPVLVVPS